MTGESTLWTLLSSTRISRAFAHRALTSDSLIISHRRSCSICRSKSLKSDIFYPCNETWFVALKQPWVERLQNSLHSAYVKWRHTYNRLRQVTSVSYLAFEIWRILLDSGKWLLGLPTREREFKIWFSCFKLGLRVAGKQAQCSHAIKSTVQTLPVCQN